MGSGLYVNWGESKEEWVFMGVMDAVLGESVG